MIVVERDNLLRALHEPLLAKAAACTAPVAAIPGDDRQGRGSSSNKLKLGSIPSVPHPGHFDQ